MSALATKLKVEGFRDFNEVLKLVTGFEKCTLSKQLWTHHAHLAVACWYLVCDTDPKAIPRIREGIKMYNISQGGANTKDSGYHETITLFWAKVIRGYLASATLECSIVHLINDLIARYSDSKFPFEYYSRERLMSCEARANWIEPDLKPLP